VSTDDVTAQHAYLAQAERSVLDAAVAFCTDDPSDPWDYGKDSALVVLENAVRHLTALRKLANTTEG